MAEDGHTTIADGDNHVEVQFLSSPCITSEPMASISVAPNGWFALAFMDGYVNVYNEQGIFQYCLFVKTYGTILVDFDEMNENLLVYPVREDLLIEVDNRGNICNASTAHLDGSEIGENITRDFSIYTAGNTYSLQYRLTSRNLRTFSVENSDNKIIFQFNEPHNWEMMLCMILLLPVGAIVLRKKFIFKKGK